ncbi:MAG: T9SS type A sorting domain-containing protein [Candidatus Eisenbacteria bacterium]|nr:T9SS type A sorting domain-containing protein [Candidatus Eisenbacteria bacterium]
MTLDRIRLTAALACAATLAVWAAGAARHATAPAVPVAAVASASPRLSPDDAIAIAVNDLSPTDGGYTLVHPRHTARFTREGVAFEARKGPEWNWTLRAAGAAAKPAAVAPVAPEVANGVVTYAREGFTERYRPGARAIEQDFVLAQAPAAGADFVLEGAIASTGAFEATEHGWMWRDAEGVVSLGRVTVVDAAGEKLAARMDVTAASARITVDGDALAHAAYPVTVDPEIGTNDFRISFMGPDGDLTYDGRNSAVAYNATNGEYLVVWEGDDDTPGNGEGEFEIFAQRINASTGAAVGANDFRVSDMGTNGDTNSDATSPAVAWNATNNEYLVVWAGDDSTGVTANGETEIFGQRLTGATGAEVGTNDFRVSDMGPNFDPNYDAENPVVSWNSVHNEYLVAWEGDDNTFPLVNGESEIFAQRLAGATGLEVGTNDFRVSDMGADGVVTSGAHAPAVAYGAGQYLVVWTGDNGAPLADDEFEIWGQRLTASTGAEAGTNDFRISDMGPDGDALYDAQDPAVSFAAGANTFFVVWSGDDNGPRLVEGEREIFGQLINATTGAETGTNDMRYSEMGPDGDPLFDARSPSVGFDSATSEYLVSWEGDDKGGGLVSGEFEIFGQLVNASTGAESRSNDFQMSNMGIPGHIHVGAAAPAVCARTNGTIEYFVVWHADSDTLGVVDDEFEVYGQRLNGQGREQGTDDMRISDMGPDGDIDWDARFPQIAYNPIDAEYLVVWEADDTTGALVDGETEIFGRRVSAVSGLPVGPLQFRISSMGADGDGAYDAQDVSVAFDATHRHWLVVWAGETNEGELVNSEFEIWGQLLDAQGNEIGVDDFRISDMGPDGDALYDANHPRATWNSLHDEFLVVWDGDDVGGTTVEGEVEIFAQRLSDAGAEIGANDFRVSSMGFDGDIAFDALDPAVAFDSQRDEYLVVWSGDDTSAVLRDGETEVFGQRLSASGAELGADDFRISTMGPDSDPLFDASKPAVAFNPVRDEYLVVWEGDDLGFALAEGETEIFGQRLTGDGLEIGADDFRISTMGIDLDPLTDAASPNVTYLPSRREYFVVWDGDDNNGTAVGEVEVYGQLLDAETGAEVDVDDVRLSDAGPDLNATFDASHPAIAFSPSQHRSLIVWQADDDAGALGPHEFEIFAQQFEHPVPLAVGDGPRSWLSLAIEGGNPVRGDAQLMLSSPEAGTFDVGVHDVAGRRVARQTVTFAAAGRTRVTVDSRSLAPGIYLVRASSGARQATQKLVIRH